MKKAALYVRVSTEEQKREGLSIDSQVEALREYCALNNMVEVDVYNDAGISARKSYKKRPALLQLIEDCKAGLVDIILFTKLDRWFRSVSDYYEVQRELDAAKVPWKCIWEDYETETSAGIFKVNIMLSVAQSESDRTSERVKKINEYKRAQGRHVGGVPWGYKRKDGKVYIDEAEQEKVQLVFDTYLKHYSVTMVTRQLQLKYKMLTTSTKIVKMLNNPAYMGKPLNNPECVAYITEEQFNDIQARLQKKARPAKGNKVYIFSGIVRCKSCGYAMCSASDHYKDRVYKQYICHYNNTKFHKTIGISERKLEKIIVNNLESQYMQWNETVEKNNKAIMEKANYKQREKLEAKLKRLTFLFEEGDISIEDYTAKRDELKKQIAEIKIEKIKKPDPLMSNWREIYTGLSDKHKKAFWRSIIKSIYISHENKNHPDIEFY